MSSKPLVSVSLFEKKIKINNQIQLKKHLNTYTLLNLTAQLNSMTVAGGAGSAIHLQNEMQHSPLAINSVSNDS